MAFKRRTLPPSLARVNRRAICKPRSFNKRTSNESKESSGTLHCNRSRITESPDAVKNVIKTRLEAGIESIETKHSSLNKFQSATCDAMSLQEDAHSPSSTSSSSVNIFDNIPLPDGILSNPDARQRSLILSRLPPIQNVDDDLETGSDAGSSTTDDKLDLVQECDNFDHFLFLQNVSAHIQKLRAPKFLTKLGRL